MGNVSIKLLRDTVARYDKSLVMLFLSLLKVEGMHILT